jgi:hypothetical protein
VSGLLSAVLLVDELLKRLLDLGSVLGLEAESVGESVVETMVESVAESVVESMAESLEA